MSPENNQPDNTFTSGKDARENRDTMQKEKYEEHGQRDEQTQQGDEDQAKTGSHRIFKIAIPLIVLLLIGGFIYYQLLYQVEEAEPVEEEKALVRVTNPERRDIEKTTSIIGNVEPAAQRMILPEMTGTVETLHVEEGDKVQEGELLFALDDEDQRIQVQEARAASSAAQAQYREAQAGAREEELEEARSAVEMAESSKEQAERELERIEALHEEGYVSDQEYEQVELQYQNARDQLRSAEAYLEMAETGAREEQLDALAAQVEQANLAVQLAERNLERTQVTAPADGEIAVLEVEEGEITGSAEPAAIMTADTMQVTAALPEAYVNKVSEGDGARVEVRAAREEKYDGVIERVATLPAEKSMSYPVEVAIDDDDMDKLKSGMFSRVIIAVERTEHALAIPRKAVMQDETGEIVYIVNREDEIEQREISTGINEDGYIEIIEGLNVSDTVVVEGQNIVMPGDSVDTTELDSEGDR